MKKKKEMKGINFIKYKTKKGVLSQINIPFKVLTKFLYILI